MSKFLMFYSKSIMNNSQFLNGYKYVIYAVKHIVLKYKFSFKMPECYHSEYNRIRCKKKNALMVHKTDFIVFNSSFGFKTVLKMIRNNPCKIDFYWTWYIWYPCIKINLLKWFLLSSSFIYFSICFCKQMKKVLIFFETLLTRWINKYAT